MLYKQCKLNDHSHLQMNKGNFLGLNPHDVLRIDALYFLGTVTLRCFQISFSSKRFDSLIMLLVVIFPVLICIPNHILCLLLMIFTVGVNLHVQQVSLD